MQSFATQRVTWLAIVVLGFGVSPAQASGGVRAVSLKQAVEGSQAVLVVKRSEPFWQAVPVRRQPKPRRQGRSESLTITYLSFTINETLFLSTTEALIRTSEIEADPPSKRGQLLPSDERGLFRMELPQQPRDLMWLVNSTEVLNIDLTRMRVEKGVNKIPIYERLDGGIEPNAIVDGKAYLLLVGHSEGYQSYEGIGGWGLLDISKREDVERLIEERSPGSREFKKRFRDLPKVKDISGCVTIEREDCSSVAERKTKRPALEINIRSIRRPSPVTAVVVGGYFEACESASSNEYVLMKQGLRWVVMRNTRSWIS